MTREGHMSRSHCKNTNSSKDECIAECYRNPKKKNLKNSHKPLKRIKEVVSSKRHGLLLKLEVQGEGERVAEKNI